jgi:hypothetical protein
MNKTRVSVAYHEAGHAVVAYALRLKVGRVTIVPDGRNAGLADVPFEYDVYYYADRSDDYMERQMACYYAGVVAEEILTGTEIATTDAFGPESAYAADRAGVVDCVGTIAGSDPALQVEVSDWGIATARKILQANWVGVQRLAEELLQQGTSMRSKSGHFLAAHFS